MDQANTNSGYDLINFQVGVNQAKTLDIVETLSLTEGVTITGGMVAGSSLTLKVKKAFVFDTPTVLDMGNQIVPQTYEIQGITFDHCTGANGAAFEVKAQNTVTTRNCAFTDNKSVSPTGGNSDGGAVYVRHEAKLVLAGGAGQPVDNGTFVGQQTVFLRNEATGDGGAVTNGGEVIIEAAWLQDNKAGGDGGAMFMFGSTSRLSTSATVTTSTFKSNTALKGNGGAICIMGGTVALSSTTFNGNDAQADVTAVPGIHTGMGGAIYSGGGFTALTGCGFDNNTAGTNTAAGVRGGDAALAITNSHVTIQNLTMGVNNKTKTGQAVYGVVNYATGWVTDKLGHTWDTTDTPIPFGGGAGKWETVLPQGNG